jgi:hypothetical protein
MRLSFCFLSATLATGFGLVAQPSAVFAQQPGSVQTAVAELPEAPRAQFEVAEAEPQAQQPPAVQSQATQQPPTSATPAQGSSSSQSSAQQPGAEKSQHEKAAEQIKEQEKQRVVGILPQFNISYRSDAASMTAAQKMRLAFRSSVDPVAFATAFVAAGYHEAMDDDPGFGWGIKGYGKRSGAAYLDSFDGDIIGNGILPSLLHQDPRYFRLGHGTFTHRLLYSLATNVICKHDNTGRWEPNYSNVSGNIISGAISNLYYPSTNSGVSQTFTNGFMVTAEGGIGSIFDEFWPDVSRKFLHRDPTHGLDAQARAADKAKKEARQEQK